MAITLVGLALLSWVVFEAARSDRGRERLRAELLSRTKSLFPGSLHLARIEGDFTHGLVLHELELRDREGRPAIRIGSLRAVYSISEVAERLHVDRLEIDRLDVQAFTTTAGINLAELIAKGEAEPEPTEPSEPLSLSIGSVVLRDSRFSLDGEQLIEDLDLSLGLAIERGRLEAHDLDLQLDGARIGADRAAYDLGTGELDAALVLTAPAALLAKLAKDPALAAGVSMTISAQHRPLGPWIARAEGSIAGAPFTLSATTSVDFARIDGLVTLRSIDPHAAHRRAPKGLLDLSAEASIEGDRIALDLDGHGELTAPTATLALDRIAATAKLAEGRLEFTGAIDSSGTLRAPAKHRTVADRVRAEGALQLDPLALEETRARVEIASVAPYLPPDLGLDAAVSLDATASGPIDSLRAVAKADVRRVAMGDLRIARIAAGVDLVGAPARPAGRASLSISSVTASVASIETVSLSLELDPSGQGAIAIRGARGTPVSSIDMQGKLRLEEGGRAALALSRAELVYRGTQVSAAPTSVQYDPTSLVIDARLSSIAGDVRAKVALDPTAPTTGPGKIELSAPELSLAGIGSLLPDPIALAGQAALSAGGKLGPDRNLSLDLALTGVGYRGTAPVGGKLELRLKKDLRGELALASDVARVAARLASMVPPDPAEWRPEDLTLLVASIAPIDLSRAAEQVVLAGGSKIELAGTASISVEMKPSGDRFAIDAAVHGAVGVPVATKIALIASAAIPRDVAAWGTLDHRVLESAVLAVDPIDVRTLAQAAGVEAPLGGRVSLKGRASAGLDRISLLVVADEVRMEQLEGEALFAEVRADASSHRVTVNGSVRSVERSLLSFEGALGAGVGDILEGARIVDRAPLRAAIDLPGFPLAVLDGPVEREGAFAGMIAGTATVGGTMASPRARVDLRGADVRIGAMDFARFEVRAGYAPESATAELDLVQAVGGSLRVRSKIGLKDQQLELDAKAGRFAIDFVNDVIPERAGVGFGGLLNADLSLRGKPEELSANGWLSLSEGRLVPPRPLGTIDSLAVDVRAKEHAIEIGVKGRSGEGELDAQIRTERTRAGLEIDGQLTTDGLPLAVGRTPVAVDLIATITGAIGAEETRIDTSIREGRVVVAERETREVHDVEELGDVVFVDERGIKEAKKKKRAQESKPPKPSRTEITVHTLSPLPVKSRDLNGSVEADIRITSGRVFGRVTLGDGAIAIGGRPWRIERARIDLDGSVPPRPVLDVSLIHEFDTVRVSILVTGTPDHPDVRFESSPPTYDQAALLAIVLGSDPDGGGDGSLQSKAAAGAAANYLVGAIRSGLGADLWLDTIAVETGEQIERPKLQLGKWITREIFLGYEHNFGATNTENAAEAVLRYRFLPGWMIESRIGDKAQGLDLFWSKRF